MLACVQLGTAFSAVASDAAIASPAFSNQQIILNAIDAGDLKRLKGHFDFIRTFRTVDPSVASTASVDVNFRDQNGNTPLMHAAMHKNVDMVRFLVDNGADINAVNSNGESALLTSYTYENYSVTTYLLAQGAADPYHLADLVQAHQQEIAQQHWEATTGMSNMEYMGGGALLVGGVVALAVGGGGGGSSSASSGFTSNLDPVTYANPAAYAAAVTALNNLSSAQNQQGILDMNVNYALARGYDGSIYSRSANGTLLSTTPTGYVKVAVVDTGIDMTHPDLVDNVLTADSVTCGDTGCVAGGSAPTGGAENWHGTAVAGIIAAERNNAVIYGVASQAKIMSIAFADPTTGDLTNGDAPGIQSALNNGAQVFNGSYGYANLTPPTADIPTVEQIVNNSYGGTNLITQYQRGVAAHAIFVYAAGNDSLTNPDVPAGLPYYFQGTTAPSGITQATYDAVNPSHLDWSKNWVAVVSVNSSNTISAFSNQCGVAMNWCLAAPGEISTSTGLAGGYTGPIQGTSFAAPNVTGAIAVMLGAWPQLTPEKVLQILFNTATDLGAAGVDPVYGHGLLNLEKATSPTDGGWSLSSFSGGAFEFNASGLGLSAPFGNALNSSHASLQFLDAYGKNYAVPLSSVAKTLTPTKTDYDKLANLTDPAMDNVLDLGNHTTLRFSDETSQDNTPGSHTDKLSKFSYLSAFPMDDSGKRNLSFAFNYKTNLTDSVAPSDQKHIASDALKNPYLNLVDAVNSSVVHYADGPSQLTMAAYFGKLNRDDYEYSFNDGKDVTGVFSEISYTVPDSKSTLSFDNGVTIEKNSLLGSEAGGAFAIDKAITYYTGVSGKYALAENVALIANYNLGVTKVAASGNSFITGVDNIVTNAFAVGSETYHVADKGDTLGFLVSQPLRVIQGGAALTLPVAVDNGGNMLYENNNLNLAPTGRELDFESYYNLKSDDNSNLGVDVMFRLEPNNTPGGNDATILATYKVKLSADRLSF